MPDIKQGDTIQLWDFRDQLTKTAVATEDEFLDEDCECREVGIRFLNGDEHYAVFNEDSNRWESGEM